MTGNTATANAISTKTYCTLILVATLVHGVAEELLRCILNVTSGNAKKVAISRDGSLLHFPQDKDSFCDRLLQSIQHFPLFFQHFLLVSENITIEHVVWLYIACPAKCLASNSILCNVAHQRGDFILHIEP